MTNRKRLLGTLAAAGLALGLTGGASAAQLEGPATIVYDQFHVPTVIAQTEHDAIFLQGYLHAKNRLFQMDFQRRLFAGRVSELVGSSGLAQDVQLRTLGLRRAAERSLPIQTPESLAWLQAYSDGVNAFLEDTSQPLPVEYGALEITRAGIPLWTPTDCLTMAKGLAFGLSFDLGDINRTLALLNYRGVCDAIGCNGLQLYNDDLWRVAPFESGVSIPSAPLFGQSPEPTIPDDQTLPSYISDPNFYSMVESYRDQIAGIPILNKALASDYGAMGSNWWVVSGAKTDSGYPMLSNDPHLSLGAPATFYEVHLNVTGGINVTGVSFPGTPGVVIGCNSNICWGATVNGMDVTDVFNEVLLAQIPGQPTTPTAILFQGNPEPLQFIPQTFMVNIIGDGIANDQVDAGVPASSGGVTTIVPRRNNGPIVQVSYNPASPTPLTGLSVAYTGWGPTQEVETLRRFARASSMQDFKDALQYFDVGSQNWAYADVAGNIAYYTSGELPIRQDLQTLFFPAGLVHPGLIRDGTNTNPHQWLPLAHPQPNQDLSTEILPFSEMPQVENPPSGYVLNANNDPIGTTLDNVTWNQYRTGFNGILYLSAGYSSGERLGRIQRQFNDYLAGTGKLSVAESASIQANNQMLDAEVLSPYLLAAYANATAPGADPALQAIVADPRIGDAIGRLAAWDFSTPTGITEGYDPYDNPAALATPGAPEISDSIAATIFALWRGQMVQRVVDSTLAGLPVPLNAYAPPSDQAMSALRRFLDNYAINGGIGSSLINFFRVPGVSDQSVARDIILLESLRNGLNLLASPSFAPAFGGSMDLNDYRWGKLHRIVFSHYLGGPFNIPPSGAPAPINPLGADLPGFPRAGGRGAVDASSHDARADGLNEFMFSSGPARRLIATMVPDCPQVLEVIPGGESGAPGSPNGTDQLAYWLVNAYKPLPVCLADVYATAAQTVQIACGNGVVDPGEECDDGNAVNSDGCNDACRFVPAITCLAPSVSADANTCTAQIACSAVANCVDPRGGAVTTACNPGGPYALGTTNVSIQCDGASGTSSAACSATVTDDTPPTVTVTTVPASLWPPNHKMANVDVTVTAVDACDPHPSIVLVSATSSEPDDAPGGGDGNTTGDIQGATLGTADFQLLLRAEREADGPGRTYTLTYQATDASGNAGTSSGLVLVPHGVAGVVEPLTVLVSGADATRLEWSTVAGAIHYDVVRGDLAALRIDGSDIELGNVTCIVHDSLATNTSGHEDTELPAPGQVFFYAVQFFDGIQESSYGSESAGRARVVSGGGCP
jgi:penicillin G amidase